jgi:hypothetical protein
MTTTVSDKDTIIGFTINLSARLIDSGILAFNQAMSESIRGSSRRPVDVVIRYRNSEYTDSVNTSSRLIGTFAHFEWPLSCRVGDQITIQTHCDSRVIDVINETTDAQRALNTFRSI